MCNTGWCLIFTFSVHKHVQRKQNIFFLERKTRHYFLQVSDPHNIFRVTASTRSWLETWGWSTRRTHRTKLSTLSWRSRCRSVSRSVQCARSTLQQRWRWTTNGLQTIPVISASNATTSSTTERMTRCYIIILCMITSRSKRSLFLDQKPWSHGSYLKVSCTPSVH
jgi:hypothetical protein